MSVTAAILTIGDELMLGGRLDTNGPWLACQLAARGVPTAQRCSVQDCTDAIKSQMHCLSKSHDLLFVTGGLGPTADDKTRASVAESLGVPLVEDEAALASIESWFASRGAVMPKENISQSLRPETASWIENKHGTAPGLRATMNQCTIVCLPGPPSELKPMFAAIIDELLHGQPCGQILQTVEVHSWGLAESIAGERIVDLMNALNPRVAILMNSHGITARITGEDLNVINTIAQEIESRWSPFVYGRNATTLAKSVGELLQNRELEIATAESCTAGFLSHLIGEVEGASSWFCGGWVTYSNALKMSQLHVPAQLLESHGAVSRQVAQSMACGAAVASDSAVGLSTTGIAGPSGGTAQKPVGTVFIGCKIEESLHVREFRFSGERDAIRRRTAYTALQMLRLELLGEKVETMCWQHESSM